MRGDFTGLAMGTFEILFGIKTREVSRICVLLPLAPDDILAGLHAPALSRGKLYSAGSSRGFTVIRTGVGAALAGDAVLWLGETACEEMVLLGSCGLTGRTKNLKVGSLISPSVCYSAESFCRLLDKDSQPWSRHEADRRFREVLVGEEGSAVHDAACLTIGSLKLQEEMLPLLRAGGIDAVEMECASVYAAAHHTGRRAAALLYATDIIGEKPFHAPLSRGDRSAIAIAVKEATALICRITERSLHG